MAQNARLPDLDSLRLNLGIPPINTGQQSPLTTPAGIFTDDIEGLNAVLDEQGRVMLQSGLEFPLYAYRGQTEKYENLPCVPKLGRTNLEEQLLSLCRNAAFEEALGEHPYVRVTAGTKFQGYPLRVDPQGLAEHYGLATDLLDFTSNFEVASFFATCYWDQDAGGYKPVVGSENPGVLYRSPPALFVGTDLGAEFEIVGWQPLKRPEQQRAFGLKMKKDMDLNVLPFVQMVKFRHCAKISTRIWKAFDEGRALFPDDAAAELARRAEALWQFTRQQVDRAWARLDAWNESETTNAYRQAVEDRSKIRRSETNTLNWDGLDIERDERKLADQLRDVLNKVRYRRAFYPV